MLYRHGTSFIFNMTNTNSRVCMYQYPDLEFNVNQDCHWHCETGCADIILSLHTHFEGEEICEPGVPGAHVIRDLKVGISETYSSIPRDGSGKTLKTAPPLDGKLLINTKSGNMLMGSTYEV